jgi:glycosyltransferase involved in cell wall biosynthesis
MELSIICPALNEIRFIDRLIDSLCYPDGLDKEVLIVDGGSSDGTRERIEKRMKEFSFLKLIDNPGITSTRAFNIAFPVSRGNYIAFVGAHAEYSPNYFQTAVSCLKNNEADVAGGLLEQHGKTKTGKAIALVMSSRAGVGNTEFRTMKKKMYVDTVAFAVYNRKVIEKTGLMNESLPVNQDDEFHYRINNIGFRILMLPEISAIYYVRDSYSALRKQYFKYGLYKPAVLAGTKKSLRIRHVIPALFTLYVLSLPFAFIYSWWLFPAFLYLFLIISVAIGFRKNIEITFLALPVFPVLHLSYGLGFIAGMFRNKNIHG